jgi:hypothetical protein
MERESTMQNTTKGAHGMNVSPADSSAGRSNEAPPMEKALFVLAGMAIGIISGLLILLIIVRPLPPRAIDWKDAKKYVGKEKTIDVMVHHVYLSKSRNTFVHTSGDFTNDFAIIIYRDYYDKFGCVNNPEGFFKTEYNGRQLRVTGMIRIYKMHGDAIPSIFVTEPNQIEVVK